MVVDCIRGRELFPQIYQTLIFSNDSRHLRGSCHFGVIVTLMIMMHVQLVEASKHLDVVQARFLSEAAQMTPTSTQT